MNFVPKDVTKEEFSEAFNKIGKVLQFTLNERTTKDFSGGSRVIGQYGYVYFQNTKDAQTAIQKLDETYPWGHIGKPVRIDFWQSKLDREKEKEQRQNYEVTKTLNNIIE